MTAKKHMISTLLIALTLALVVQAQPGQGRNRVARGMRPGQNQRGQGMGQMEHQGPGRGQAGGPGLNMMRFLRQLKLTEEQHEVVRSILDTHKEAAQAGHEEVQSARKSLHEAVIGEADEAALRAIAATLAEAVGDQAIQQVAVVKEIKNVLTEAQKATLKTLMEQPPEDRQRGPQGPPRGRGRGPGRRGQGPGPQDPGE